MRTQIANLENLLRLRDATIAYERQQRVSAQRGLVPYVRSLERFNAWLRDRPTLHDQLALILKELGLYDIKIGYDPDEDPEVQAMVS